MADLLLWNIYEITPGSNPITGVMFRGRFRNFTIKNNITALVENAADKPGVVRVALPVSKDNQLVFLQGLVDQIVTGTSIIKVLSDTPNPILRKLHQNDCSIYG